MNIGNDILSRPTISLTNPSNSQNDNKNLSPKRNNLRMTIQSDKEPSIIDEKLHESFKYFKKEFIDAAVSSSVTIPLDIIEDKTNRVFNFIKFDGPKYILQIIPNNTDNNHLIRTSLSLLVVIVQILTRKMSYDDINTNSKRNLISSRNKSSNNIMKSISFVSSAPVNLLESVSQWAIDSLHQIIQNGNAISICINLLIHTVITSIHELTLILINLLILISEDALIQMFNLPNSLHFTDIKPHLRYNNFNKYLLSKKNMSALLSDDSNRRSSVEKLMKLHNKNKQVDMLTTRLPESLSPLRQRRISNSSKTTTSKGSASNMSNRPSSSNNPMDNNIVLINGSCLSLILYIVKMNKNKHVIMCNYCDIVISMITYCNTENIENICNIIAQMPSYTTTTTNKKNTKSNFKEWDGINQPILFLARYMKYSNELVDEYISTQHRQQLYYTFKQILLAISYLVSGSVVVCNHVISLPDVMNVLQATYDTIKPDLSPNDSEIIERCFADMNELTNKDPDDVSSIKFKKNRDLLSPLRHNPVDKLLKETNETFINHSSEKTARNTMVSVDNLVEQRKTIHKIKKLFDNDHQSFSTDPFSPDYMFSRSVPTILSPNSRLSIMSPNNRLTILSPKTINSLILSTEHNLDDIVRPSTVQSHTRTIKDETSKKLQPVYLNPESPKRRGLSPIHRYKSDTNLSKTLFENLPQLPTLPDRLNELEVKRSRETQESSANNEDNTVNYNLIDGQKLLDMLSKRAVNKIKKEDLVESKKSLTEQLREVYKPTEYLKLPLLPTAARRPSPSRQKSWPSRGISTPQLNKIERMEQNRAILDETISNIIENDYLMNTVEIIKTLGFKFEFNYEDSNIVLDSMYNLFDANIIQDNDVEYSDNLDSNRNLSHKKEANINTKLTEDSSSNDKLNTNKLEMTVDDIKINNENPILVNNFVRSNSNYDDYPIDNPLLSQLEGGNEDDEEDELSRLIHSSESVNISLLPKKNYNDSLSYIIRKSSIDVLNDNENDELDQSISDLLIQSNDLIFY